MIDWLDEMSKHGGMSDCVPMFDELYCQVAHDIRHRIAALLDAEKVELTVSLMEADPERYAVE